MAEHPFMPGFLVSWDISPDGSLVMQTWFRRPDGVPERVGYRSRFVPHETEDDHATG